MTPPGGVLAYQIRFKDDKKIIKTRLFITFIFLLFLVLAAGCSSSPEHRSLSITNIAHPDYHERFKDWQRKTNPPIWLYDIVNCVASKTRIPEDKLWEAKVNSFGILSFLRAIYF